MDGAASAWSHDYPGAQIACGGISGNEIRNFFKFNPSALVGSVINSVVFSVRLKDNRANYYPNGAVWPYNTNGQGNIGLGTFATELTLGVRANEYLTGQTNIAAADGTIISYTMPSAALTHFAAAIAAAGFWSFSIGFENDSNYGNGLFYVDDETVATAGNRPQILVDHTPAGGSLLPVNPTARARRILQTHY